MPARERFDRFWKMRRTSGSGPVKETRRRLGVFTTPIHVGHVFGVLGWILLAASVVLWFSGTAPLAALAYWVSSSIVLLAIGSALGALHSIARDTRRARELLEERRNDST